MSTIRFAALPFAFDAAAFSMSQGYTLTTCTRGSDYWWLTLEETLDVAQRDAFEIALEEALRGLQWT